MVRAELSAMGWEKDKHFSAVFLFPLPEKLGLLYDFQREVKVVTTLFFLAFFWLPGAYLQSYLEEISKGDETGRWKAKWH